MQQYRKKQVLVKATQWHKEGDHPAVKSHQFCGYRGCSACDGEDKTYYFIKSPQGRVMYVNPGYWILESEDGSFDVWSPTSFEQSFEPAPPPSSHQGDFKDALKEQVADESLDKLEKALFIDGATWAKDYLSQFTAPPTPVEGPTPTIWKDIEEELIECYEDYPAMNAEQDARKKIDEWKAKSKQELQGRNGLKWVKASERLPEKDGIFCVKINGGYCNAWVVTRKNDVRRIEISGGYVLKGWKECEWLDESDSPAPEQVDPEDLIKFMTEECEINYEGQLWKVPENRLLTPSELLEFYKQQNKQV